MNNDENNWNTDNTENATNGDKTWNTDTTNTTTDGTTDNKDTWNTNTTDTTGTTTDNKDTWNTNTTGNTTNTTTGTTTSSNVDEANVSTKNRMTALMLCWFLGLFGVHRLYAGKLGSGFLMLYGTVCSLLIMGLLPPVGVMCLITMVALVANDFAFLAFGQFKDCYGKIICSDKLQ